jgi:hypothetical protein
MTLTREFIYVTIQEYLFFRSHQDHLFWQIRKTLLPRILPHLNLLCRESIDHQTYLSQKHPYLPSCCIPISNRRRRPWLSQDCLFKQNPLLLWTTINRSYPFWHNQSMNFHLRNSTLPLLSYQNFRLTFCLQSVQQKKQSSRRTKNPQKLPLYINRHSHIWPRWLIWSTSITEWRLLYLLHTTLSL